MTTMTIDVPGAATAKRAVLYRMATDEHLCPSGLKARDLLRREGFAVDDRLLTTRAAVDAFKAEHGVPTTPQVFIDGRRIGGYDALRAHLGLSVRDPKARTYRPVLVIFAATALLALAVGWRMGGDLLGARSIELFAGFATLLLAAQKLRDVDGFATGFLGYDLLARRFVPYAYAYPYAEALVGLLMVAGALPWLMAPIALLIGGVGAASVAKAVYVDKRDLACACVGGGSNVPLGAVSLTENLVMVAMAVWAAAGPIAGGM